MFESVDDVISQLQGQGYICGKNIATVVYLASQLEKPVLVEGPAGVGKTELAKAVSPGHRSRADPPAVLRGPRRGQGALRVGVLEAAPLHADPEGEVLRGDGRLDHAQGGRRARRAGGQRLLLRPLHRSASAAAGDHGRGAHAPADRRGRQVRPGVRGLPARGALGLPGDGARDRHPRGQAEAHRLPHLERRARDERRPEAPLPAPLHRLPGRGSRVPDPRPSASRASSSGWPRSWSA